MDSKVKWMDIHNKLVLQYCFKKIDISKQYANALIQINRGLLDSSSSLSEIVFEIKNKTHLIQSYGTFIYPQIHLVVHLVNPFNAFQKLH